MQPFVVQGDKTSHGGTVITGSSLSDCDGKPIARVGDMSSCPLCKGVFPIVQGDQSNIIDGVPVAYHGCKTACGAMLISGQIRTLTEPSSGAVPGAEGGGTSGSVNGFGLVGSGLAASYQDESHEADPERFQGRFQLISVDTGEPVAGKPVRVRSTDGQYLTGTTDAEGFTQWVERKAAESLAFDLNEEST